MRRRGRLTGLVVAALLAAPAPAQQVAESINPAPHILPWPDLGTGRTQVQNQASLNLGPELQRGHSARALLAERRRLDTALAALEPQRPGTVDAYVVAVA